MSWVFSWRPPVQTSAAACPPWRRLSSHYCPVHPPPACTVHTGSQTASVLFWHRPWKHNVIHATVVYKQLDLLIGKTRCLTRLHVFGNRIMHMIIKNMLPPQYWTLAWASQIGFDSDDKNGELNHIPSCSFMNLGYVDKCSCWSFNHPSCETVEYFLHYKLFKPSP